MRLQFGAAVLAATLALAFERGARADELDGIFRFQAAKAIFTPTALGQLDVAPYVGDDARVASGDLAERPGFRLRRARFGLAGLVAGELEFRVNAGLLPEDQNQVGLHEGYLAWRPGDGFRILGGFADVPFSIYSSTDIADGALSERPLGTRALAPLHQLGIQYEAIVKRRLLALDLGVFNAFQRTDQFFQGYVENPAALGNRFDGIALAGRLTSEPFGPIGPTMQRFYGERLRMLVSLADFVSFGGTKVTDAFDAGLLVHWRGAHLASDFTLSLARPKDKPTQASASPQNVTSWSWVAELGYLFTAKRISGGDGGYGALGFTGRFELLDPNTDVQDQADTWALTGGVSMHLFENSLKGILEYTHREERHGQSLKNDILLLSTIFRIGERPLQ